VVGAIQHCALGRRIQSKRLLPEQCYIANDEALVRLYVVVASIMVSAILYSPSYLTACRGGLRGAGVSDHRVLTRAQSGPLPMTCLSDEVFCAKHCPICLL